MSGFSSGDDYISFAAGLMFPEAFPDSTQFSDQFLTALELSCDSRVSVLPAGTRLWRARNSTIGPNGVGDVKTADPLEVILPPWTPHGPEGMIPTLEHAAKGGRTNAPGVVHLYLATTPETAVAEIRPWVGLLVSVAEFRTTGDLRLLDLTADLRAKQDERNETAGATVESRNWVRVCHAFKVPVDPSETSTSYRPTQRIALHFEIFGLQGVRYTSALGSGQNVALFNVCDAAIDSVHVRTVTRVTWCSEVQNES